MTNSIPPLMGLGSSMVVTTCLFREVITTIIDCTRELFLKTSIGTLTSLLVS
jgi:hypothetical protein